MPVTTTSTSQQQYQYSSTSNITAILIQTFKTHTGHVDHDEDQEDLSHETIIDIFGGI